MHRKLYEVPYSQRTVLGAGHDMLSVWQVYDVPDPTSMSFKFWHGFVGRVSSIIMAGKDINIAPRIATDQPKDCVSHPCY